MKEFVARLKREIDLKEIDYIVMNHNEIDHSGALPELLREIPGLQFIVQRRGEAILRGHYHQDWNYVNVKTGDTLDLGESTLTFIEAPMLHWPDTTMGYLSGEEILFSNDVFFGQHFAMESLYYDLVKHDDLMGGQRNIMQISSTLIGSDGKPKDEGTCWYESFNHDLGCPKP